MGYSGSQYDKTQGSYQPNKDRRMAEWRKKKDAERKAAEEARLESARRRQEHMNQTQFREPEDFGPNPHYQP